MFRWSTVPMATEGGDVCPVNELSPELKGDSA